MKDLVMEQDLTMGFLIYEGYTIISLPMDVKMKADGGEM